MPQWPGSPKKTSQFNKLTSENIRRLSRSTKTPALWLKAVWRTPLRAALFLAKHGTLGSTTWVSNFSAFWGETKKSTIFKGILLLIPLHLQGQLHFQFHLAMIWPQLPRSLPPQEVRDHSVACGKAWSFHRLGPHWRHGVRKLQPCWVLDEQGDCWSLPCLIYATYSAHTRQHILEGYHQIFRLSSIQSLHQQQQQQHHHNHQ